MSNDLSDAKICELEERRYNYLIETYLFRVCEEENDPDHCYQSKSHVARARRFGMTPEAIWERLSNDSWYEDMAPPATADNRRLPPMTAKPEGGPDD